MIHFNISAPSCRTPAKIWLLLHFFFFFLPHIKKCACLIEQLNDKLKPASGKCFCPVTLWILETDSFNLNWKVTFHKIQRTYKSGQRTYKSGKCLEEYNKFAPPLRISVACGSQMKVLNHIEAFIHKQELLLLCIMPERTGRIHTGEECVQIDARKPFIQTKWFISHMWK